MPHIKTGGAAFPANPNNAHCEPGMTLRDYFAAKAMQGMIAGLLADGSKFDAMKAGKAISQHAYAVADAMLESRDGGLR